MGGFCFRYLIQYKPIPGMLNEMYCCPLGETPYRMPGIPQLHPTPRLDNVQRNGPRPNTLRHLHTSYPPCSIHEPKNTRFMYFRNLISSYDLSLRISFAFSHCNLKRSLLTIAMFASISLILGSMSAARREIDS